MSELSIFQEEIGEWRNWRGVMKTKRIHIDHCRNPVNTCNHKCERSRCAEREFGKYEIFKIDKGKVIVGFTKYGWKVTWSDSYQNDSNLGSINKRIKKLDKPQNYCYT